MKKIFIYEPALKPDVLINARKENFCTSGSKYTPFDSLVLVYILPSVYQIKITDIQILNYRIIFFFPVVLKNKLE